ncbi:DUF6795 domain-containing protein [Halioxenophilus sp. WMMB6]|uniref:DUF6795 domain-containing protein n=1 Tax=Halioxenophilus sp. WMMB6 TaxID=3073815 RepID=UPI00295E7DEA|nr:DUF6795 domain-containing protein [Halioxenophilus sp. WMMB6]
MTNHLGNLGRLILIASLALTNHQASTMGILTNRVCLFTGFEAQLTYQGKPAAGAEVMIRNEYKGKTTELRILSDNEGKFRFESIYGEENKLTLSEFISQSTNFCYLPRRRDSQLSGRKVTRRRVL